MDDTNPAAQRAALEIGNRLSDPPSERLIETAFAGEVAGQDVFLRSLSMVDLAHVLTLHDQEIVPTPAAAMLVRELLELIEHPESFAARPECGDLYTNREVFLASRCSSAGWLGTARARREALTTSYYLLLRERLIEFGCGLIDYLDVLLSESVKYRDALMPDYTYLQAAQPTSFGHYLSGFVGPALRDLDRAASLYQRLDESPAGCGSSNGSVIFQDRAAQSRRLGFRGPIRHARDAMWQADIPIESMAVAVAAVVNFDRLCEDLMVFATAEFGLVRIADRHSRASKILPQKRNPFALAYVRGLANRLIGEQVGVAASARTPTGQMDSRMVPYEAVPRAFSTSALAAHLLAEVVGDMEFDEARASALLDGGVAAASDLAERLCEEVGFDYRSAHGIVGRLVTKLEREGRRLGDLSDVELQDECWMTDSSRRVVPTGLLDKARDSRLSLEARFDVGGAAPGELDRLIAEAQSETNRHRIKLEQARHLNSDAERSLLGEARALISEAR